MIGRTGPKFLATAIFAITLFSSLAAAESISFEEDSSLMIVAAQNATPLISPFKLQVKGTSPNFKNGSEAFIAERDDDGEWEIGSTVDLEGDGLDAELEISYEGGAFSEKHFALLTKRDDGNYAGREFTVSVDWREYQAKLEQWLVPVLVAAAAIFAAFALLGIAALACFSRKQKHRTAFEGEYSPMTLLMPFSSRLGLLENLSNVLVNVYFWALELGLLTIFLLFVFIVDFLRVGGVSSLLIFLIGGAVAFSFPFAYAVAIWLLDYREREPLRFVLSLFLWGTLAAFFSLLANTSLSLFLSLLIPAGALVSIISALFIAPLVEEFLKGFGVMLLSFHHEFDDMMDGLAYGFTVGVGFSFAENWLYFASNAPPPAVGFEGWIGLLAMRTFLSSLGHGMFTAITGAAIGYAKQRGIRNAQLAFMPAVAAAALLHMLFNFAAILDAVIAFLTKIDMPFFTFPLVAISLSLFAAAIYFALKTGRKV